MNIIIGGPPSSGSSLLSVLLSRHSDIYIEQETHLLSKAGLYDLWLQKRKAIYSEQYVHLPSPGWHMLNGVIMPAYDDQHPAKLEKMVHAADSLPSFLNEYFSDRLHRSQRRIWGEKTPSNIYFFDRIHRILPASLFICPIRHPYDIIASLIHRGLSVYDACGLCLTQLYMAYEQLQDIDACVVKYEDMVTAPAQTMSEVFAYIGVPFEDVFQSSQEQVRLSGWNYYEDGAIGTASVNRFFSLNQHHQDYIQSFVSQFTVNAGFINQIKPAAKQDPSTIDINYLATYFGYKLPVSKRNHVNDFKMAQVKDRCRRLLKLHPSFIHYPITRKQKHQSK